MAGKLRLFISCVALGVVLFASSAHALSIGLFEDMSPDARSKYLARLVNASIKDLERQGAHKDARTLEYLFYSGEVSKHFLQGHR